MFRTLRSGSLCCVLAACGTPSAAPPDHEALAERSVACAPQMWVFPVDAPHNIGYDHASCGSGTCAISCPDDHANSDWGGSHHGIDVFAFHRAPLVAVADAEVVAVGTVSATSGLRVRLRDACGWEYYYGHTDEAVVSVGQHVAAGELVAYMGATGTGSTHLHFNVSPDGDYSHDIDPFGLLDQTSPTACDGGGGTGNGGGGGGGLPDPVAPAGCGWLEAGEGLGVDEAIGSCDGRFAFVMQGDGNLVLYQAGVGALWDSQTWGHPGARAYLQEDGNLVVYDPTGRPLWDSQTWGHPGAGLAVQDDGNVVVYLGDRPLWDTQTCCR